MPFARVYARIKRELPQGTILLVRLGDFYEAVGEDATIVAPILGVNPYMRGEHPMCGFPVHTINSQLAKLVRVGKSVALAVMMEPNGRSIGRYEVVRVITPGTAEKEGA